MSDHPLDRYQRDRRPDDLLHLFEAHRPLVYTVCRRYLRDPADVDDAAQETFLRLTQHVHTLRGSLPAWLTATAYSATVDLIRRQSRERRRRHDLAHLSRPPSPLDAEHRLLHDHISSKLDQALLLLSPAERSLILERFVRKTPLRLIAGESTSVATAHRRVAAALASLSFAMRDLGIRAADDLTLAEHFGDPARLSLPIDSDPLRFAPDWHFPLLSPAHAQGLAGDVPLLPGWTRPLRVGVWVSYLSSRILTTLGTPVAFADQVRAACLLTHPGIQLVGVIEPDSADRAPIERTLRDHQITSGLVDATDPDSLRTLDVLVLGVTMSLIPAAARAINIAVRSGVGLLNEWWTGTYDNGRTSPDIQDLMLSASPISAYHTGDCLGFLPATVLQEHPLLPGLHAGHQLSVSACGPIYQPAPSAQVLIAKNVLVPPESHTIPALGPTRMPVLLVGTLGLGRAAVVNTWAHSSIADHASVPLSDYLLNFITWLAAPRRTPDPAAF